MDKAFEQIRDMARTAGEADRRKLLDGVRDLAYSLESPKDTTDRIMFLNLQISCVRVGIDLKLFDFLFNGGGSWSIQELAQKTGASLNLLGRLMRYLASIGTISEDRADFYSANNITRALADPGNQSGIHHYFDTVGPLFQGFPDSLRETGYRDISSNTSTVFQKVWETKDPGFVWLQHNAEKFSHFNKWMQVQREGIPDWLSQYPIEQETKGWRAEDPLFVDVGGGLGHQCAGLRERYPNIPGRVILQDVPQALAQAVPLENVEMMAHDFFQPQPVKGAKYYYLRNILHDYPDDKCQTILGHLKDAVGQGSLILVDDMVLPDSKAPWRATQLDMTMMIGLGSSERTREQWHTLFNTTGLKIKSIIQYTVSEQDSVIALSSV